MESLGGEQKVQASAGSGILSEEADAGRGAR